MKGRSIPYSATEMEWLEANRRLVISDYAAGFNALFGRNVAAKNLHALRKRKGWKTGRTGCFEKGDVPHNKGKPCEPGEGGRHPNARKTQFKKGHGRSGVAVKLYKPIGSERLSKNGYLERKIHDGLPLQSRWRAVHIVEWEAVNGPLPKGHALKCLDGDRLNTNPSNWIAIPRGVLPRLNGGRATRVMAYDTAPDELKPVLLNMARVEQKASELRHKRQEAA